MTTYNVTYSEPEIEFMMTQKFCQEYGEYDSASEVRAWAVKGIAVSVLSTLAVFGGFIVLIVR